MPELSFSCSVSQGFNFLKDSQDRVGHINSLKIAGQDMVSDISVDDPENAGGDSLKAFGVVSSIYWEGGYADAVQFTCQVSTENKKALATLVHTTMTNTEVEMEFTIYDYDPEQKQYYKCLHCEGTPLLCLIQKSGGELSMAIDNEEAMEVVSPKNFTFSLGCMPQDQEQQIHVAVSVSDKFVKQFGVTVGA